MFCFVRKGSMLEWKGIDIGSFVVKQWQYTRPPRPETDLQKKNNLKSILKESCPSSNQYYSNLSRMQMTNDNDEKEANAGHHSKE